MTLSNQQNVPLFSVCFIDLGLRINRGPGLGLGLGLSTTARIAEGGEVRFQCTTHWFQIIPECFLSCLMVFEEAIMFLIMIIAARWPGNLHGNSDISSKILSSSDPRPDMPVSFLGDHIKGIGLECASFWVLSCKSKGLEKG